MVAATVFCPATSAEVAALRESFRIMKSTSKALLTKVESLDSRQSKRSGQRERGVIVPNDHLVEAL